MPKLDELLVAPGTILLTRSGTTGNPVLVGRRMTRFAVTDDAIRIAPGAAPIGFVYAFLASSLAKALMAKGAYGKVVSHIEAKHVSSIPTPDLPPAQKNAIHERILRAYALRDEANELLDEADRRLHDLLGLTPFREEDIEYVGGTGAPRAFSVPSAGIENRLDAANHIPLARSVRQKLDGCRFATRPLGELCNRVVIPPRFKRNYVGSGYGIPYLLPSQLPTIRFYGLKRLAERQAAGSPEYLLKEGQLLVTTDGTVGRVRPVSRRMAGWFGSNNMARLSDDQTDINFLYAFLASPYGFHQLSKAIYGGVVDHLTDADIRAVVVPDVPPKRQQAIGDLVRRAFDAKDDANEIEDSAIAEFEASFRYSVPTPVQQPDRDAEESSGSDDQTSHHASRTSRAT